MQNSVFPAIKKLRPNIKYVAPGHNDKILNLIKKYMPLYLKIFITNTLFFRNKKKSLLSMRVLEDQSSIYYNDMMLIKNVCLEKLKDE